MRRITFLTLFSIITFTFLGQSFNLTLRVNGIEKAGGKMSIALFDNAEDFSSKESYVAAIEVPVKSDAFEYRFENINQGTYAMAIFHDLDENGKLTTNWIGMPKEPFGFSNDAKGRMGPPDYEDALFKVNQDIEIVINLKKL